MLCKGSGCTDENPTPLAEDMVVSLKDFLIASTKKKKKNIGKDQP